jgi:energy-coupling factor transporter ATP-binding protein EcfA2
MLKLKFLSFDALRGATQRFELKFEPGKKIVIVFGENGSGKSTICDALDLLGNDELSSLVGKGLSRTEKYWHSTTRKAGDINITLESTSESWSAQVIQGKCIVSPAETRPKVKILRRHRILDLLASKPSDRYQALQPFLAIESIDDSERSLRDLINSTKRLLSEADSRIGENLLQIEKLWKQAGSPGLDMMLWAEAEAKREFKDLDVAITAIQDYQRLSQILSSRIIDLDGLIQRRFTAQAALNQCETELADALSTAESGSEELTELFQVARHYFERHERPETCPLCQSREFAKTLPEAVDSKLRALAKVRAAMNSRTTAQRATESVAAQIETVTGSARSAAAQVRDRCDNWPSDLPSVAAVLQRASSPDVQPQEELRQVSVSASKLARDLETELTRRIELRTLLQTVRGALDQYKHNKEQKTELDSLLPRLNKAHEIFVDERRAFVDEVLNSIATRVGELYEEIHPKEGLSNISLQLDPSKRASLEVVSQFPSANDPPPAAYLSESHLDTLGICIFLALAELEDPGDTILILDDVVASVDEPHVDRIINMLYDVSQGFAHCLLTTHYQPWREKFRWGKLQKGECQFFELGPWTLSAGLITSKTMPRIEVLRGHLQNSPPEAADICACAGVTLEGILNFLADQYECSVPRRRGKPGLQDLLQSIKGKLRSALRVEFHDGVAAGAAATTVALGPILERIEKFANARNVMGCHFNEIAFHLNPADAVQFGTLVLELAEALIHPAHGWPTSEKSGEYWSNSGQSRRLYPLKQPA